MKQYSGSLVEMVSSFWRNRSLIWQMSKREVIGRYRGSMMGLAWSFFSPVLMLVVYTLVFSGVFKARWGVPGEESKADFAIILFTGLIVHGLFAECINRAPGLILSNVNYVKKVVFPLEILPWVAMGSALFHAAISLVVLLIAQLFVNFHLPWTTVFIPVVILPLVVGTMGFAWMLSATGVFVRDVTQTTGIITTALMFVSPVFYPVSALPAEYQRWLLLNPLTFIIEQARDVIIWARTPDWTGWSVSFTAGIAIAWMGFWWFQRTRRGFADVL